MRSVALPTLLTLFAVSESRRLGTLLALYTLTILLSSAYLGWHYLIDGYAAIAIVFVIHRVVHFRMPLPK
jgi:hypothetical protein